MTAASLLATAGARMIPRQGESDCTDNEKEKQMDEKMKPIQRKIQYWWPAALALSGLASQFLALAAGPASQTKTAFTPDTIQWGEVPSFLAPGAKLAVLEGDPTATSGDFTVRLKMPAGYRIAPHWHPHRENVTVISGRFKVGMGDSFDQSKMGTFPAGSFAYLDPNMHHYAMAEGEVVVQVHGESPLQFNYINQGAK